MRCSQVESWQVPSNRCTARRSMPTAARRARLRSRRCVVPPPAAGLRRFVTMASKAHSSPRWRAAISAGSSTADAPAGPIAWTVVAVHRRTVWCRSNTSFSCSAANSEQLTTRISVATSSKNSIPALSMKDTCSRSNRTGGPLGRCLASNSRRSSATQSPATRPQPECGRSFHGGPLGDPQHRRGDSALDGNTRAGGMRRDADRAAWRIRAETGRVAAAAVVKTPRYERHPLSGYEISCRAADGAG